MSPVIAVRVPGRVNLIGEHTDYQEGLVLPFAVDLALTIAAEITGEATVRFTSDQAPGIVAFRPGEEAGSIEPAWGRYPAAMLGLLAGEGLETPGFRARVSGDLPPGAGLSSSAALTVGTALLAVAAAGETGRSVPEGLTDPVRIARLCRRAEGLAAGVRCGLMDPLSLLCSRPGSALLLDCRSLARRHVPVDGERLALVLADSGVRRTLGGGAYNLRREECEEAVSVLRGGGMALFTLRDLEPADLNRARGLLPDRLYRRARHVVTENQRVRTAAAALAGGDPAALGILLDASHESLRTDFEVSCTELDDLAATARGVPGVFGCRMTGGGFGGMVLIAVRPEALALLSDRLPPAARPRSVTPGPAASRLR